MTRPTATLPSSSPAGDAGFDAGEVIENLLQRGFRQSGSGEHVLLERDGLRIVVPARGRFLPGPVAGLIEGALAPQLGDAWLTDRGPASRPRFGTRVVAGERTLHLLETLVVREGLEDPWCAFLVDDFSVIGFGAEREDALGDLKMAAAAFLELDSTDLILLTPSVV